MLFLYVLSELFNVNEDQFDVIKIEQEIENRKIFFFLEKV